MKGLILFAVMLNPVELTAEDRVDVAESNFFYDENGRLVFQQIIYYDWCPRAERYQVVAWRIVKVDTSKLPREPCPGYVPERDWGRGGYVSLWNEGDVLRRVRADSFRESWTQYDPELAEREVLAKEKRAELRRIK